MSLTLAYGPTIPHLCSITDQNGRRRWSCTIRVDGATMTSGGWDTPVDAYRFAVSGMTDDQRERLRYAIFLRRRARHESRCR